MRKETDAKKDFGKQWLTVQLHFRGTFDVILKPAI